MGRPVERYAVGGSSGHAGSQIALILPRAIFAACYPNEVKIATFFVDEALGAYDD